MVFSLKNAKKIFSMIEWLLIFFLILSTNSVYFVSNLSWQRKTITYSMYFLPILLGALAFMMLDKEKVRFYNRYIYFYVGYVVYFFILLFTIVYPYEQNVKFFIVKYLILPFCYIFYFIYLSQNRKINSFFKKLSVLMHIISGVSLFFWLFGSVLRVIPVTSNIIINWGTTYKVPSYFGVYFETQHMQLLGQTLIRNTAIFTEPPMFSYIVIITLLGDLFFLKKGIKDIVFFFIVILTSGSAFGTSIVTMIMVVYVIMKILKKEKYKVTKSVKLITGVISVCAFSLILFVLYNRIINGGGSVGIHMQDFVVGYKAWEQHPIFGNGLNNFQSMTNYMSVSRLGNGGNSGLSSGVMFVMAYGGIYWLIFYLLPLIIDLGRNLYLKSSFVLVDLVFMLLFVFVEIYSLNLTLVFLMCIWQQILHKSTLNWQLDHE